MVIRGNSDGMQGFLGTPGAGAPLENPKGRGLTAR